MNTSPHKIYGVRDANANTRAKGVVMDFLAADTQCPWPWPGRKTAAMAAPVLAHFDDPAIRVYCEPFAGSASMLLQAPIRAHEILNDSNGAIVNALRAIKHDPVATAYASASMPVSECDLQAWAMRLKANRAALTDRLTGDPDYYDPTLAGAWIHGVCNWIGMYCDDGPWGIGKDSEGFDIIKKIDDGKGIRRSIPHLGNDGTGISRSIPHLGDGKGIRRSIPHLGDDGTGISRSIPQLGNDGTGTGGHAARVRYVLDILKLIRDRLTDVRITCGDWQRVLTPSALHAYCGKPVAIYLDPPYAGTEYIYANKETPVSAAVEKWCIEHGADPLYRIAIAGRGTEHDALLDHGWTKSIVAGRSGYSLGNATNGRLEEAHWLSPNSPSCINRNQLVIPSLFD